MSTREPVPFRVVTADGETIDLAYSSPRPVAGHDERALLEETPWFEQGKPLRNYMLHETDFYDEVEQIWGTRWARRGSGSCARSSSRGRRRTKSVAEYADEWQYSMTAGSSGAAGGAGPEVTV